MDEIVMNEEVLMEKSIELRRKLYALMQEFWKDNPALPMEQVFFVNSVVTSSLVAQVVYMLFKKDIGIKHQMKYIDQICEFAKQQFKNGKWDMEVVIKDI